MEDAKTEFLKATKLLLGINDDEKDDVILLMIDEVTDAAKAYCRLEALPRQLESFIPTLAARRYQSNYDGGVKVITEGDRRVEYKDEEYDFIREYASRLKPFVSRDAKVPSDLSVKEVRG